LCLRGVEGTEACAVFPVGHFLYEEPEDVIAFFELVALRHDIWLVEERVIMSVGEASQEDRWKMCGVPRKTRMVRATGVAVVGGGQRLQRSSNGEPKNI